MTSNVLAEFCYAGIVAVAGVREYKNSKSKLSLIVGLCFYSVLTIGAYWQSFNSNKCSVYRTTSGFVAVICLVITLVIRMSVIVDPRFFKRHIGTFKTYGLLSLLSIFRYNVAIKGCEDSVLEIFLAILFKLQKNFRKIIIILTTEINYIDALLKSLIINIAIHILIQLRIEFFDYRFML
ncbi:GSCOCG00005641001-RA-CDS [Cotesia congregata]|nr:GSCOCG00005641001-RA-CDS [Cotesia congregata]